jgi:hypothetical protein
VVDVRVETDAPVLPALDDGHRPQGVRAVERHGVELADAGLELRVRARRGQGHVAQVVVEIDLRHLHPDRVRHPERELVQLAAQHRRQGQALLVDAAHVAHEAATVARRRLEQAQRADVHRHGRRFEVQERAVDPAQELHPLRFSALRPPRRRRPCGHRSPRGGRGHSILVVMSGEEFPCRT